MRTARSRADSSSALVQEWSTLFFDPRLKVAVGFGAMIPVLLLRPQGIFGRREEADR